MKDDEAPTLPQGRIDRLVYLEAATNTLASNVEALTKIVEANTRITQLLREEINKKPDDSELLAIAGFSKTERVRFMRRMTIVLLVAIITAGFFSYWFSKQYLNESIYARNTNLHASCLKTNRQIDAVIAERRELINAETYNHTPGIDKIRTDRITAYSETIDKFKSLHRDCDKLYPLH